MPNNSPKRPSEKQISRWFDFISKNFLYRFNWALGSVVALALSDIRTTMSSTYDLDEWPKTGLPWIVFWLKELIVWGTLEPVAALLLARQYEITRSNAESAAAEYARERGPLDDPNEKLNPSSIRDWVAARYPRQAQSLARPPVTLEAELLRDFSASNRSDWRVVPVTNGDEINWFDVAGYALAKSATPAKWGNGFLHSYDFVLDSAGHVVRATPYV